MHAPRVEFNESLHDLATYPHSVFTITIVKGIMRVYLAGSLLALDC